ncbi:uncharacterized protein LOC107856622 [Capsicum annuum]|uniref:uncharacterized protein LOC107856622 n=1 Tax=Capsicum annuum TaxID=4072 RepID=UPI0007BF6896|nr:uncharacterized protein LOC107856622 [Capsicum annuum]
MYIFCGHTSNINSETKWCAKRDVVGWMTSMISKHHCSSPISNTPRSERRCALMPGRASDEGQQVGDLVRQFQLFNQGSCAAVQWFKPLRSLYYFQKQPLYLHEVVVLSAYTLPSSDLTCGISLGMLLFFLMVTGKLKQKKSNILWSGCLDNKTLAAFLNSSCKICVILATEEMIHQKTPYSAFTWTRLTH